MFLVGKSLNKLYQEELHIFCWFLWVSLFLFGQRWSSDLLAILVLYIILGFYIEIFSTLRLCSISKFLSTLIWKYPSWITFSTAMRYLFIQEKSWLRFEFMLKSFFTRKIWPSLRIDYILAKIDFLHVLTICTCCFQEI